MNLIFITSICVAALSALSALSFIRAADAGITTNITGAAVLAPPAPPELPAPVREVVRLAQTTLGETVLVDYIATIKEPYSLAADQIIYLRDLGVPDAAIQALLKHQLANPPASPASALVASASPATSIRPAEILTPTSASVSTLAGDYPAANSDPLATPVTESVFRDALDPYGNWVDVPGYGLCWQPTVALINPAWRPYCDEGSWIWSDSGWYWRSGYSWGWAPFHYGRWHLATGRGWCWVPDTFWGPAWVTWRSSDTYCGWAPLPPGSRWVVGVGLVWRGGRAVYDCDFGLGAANFVYLGWGNFTDPRPWRYCLARTQVLAVHRQARPVNDIHSNPQTRGDGVHNWGVVNNGPGIKPVVEHSRGPITRVHLVDSPDVARTLPGHLAARPVGGPNFGLPVYRPSAATPIVARPADVGVHPTSPVNGPRGYSGATESAIAGSRYRPPSGVAAGARPAPSSSPTVDYRQTTVGMPTSKPISGVPSSPNNVPANASGTVGSARAFSPPTVVRPAPNYYNNMPATYHSEAPRQTAEPSRNYSAPVQAPGARVPAYSPPVQSNGNSGGGNSQPQRYHNQPR